MYLALLELRAALGRFLLMGSVVVLVAALVGIVSGFTTGLGDDTVSALRALPADRVVFSADAESDQFNRSLVDDKVLDARREAKGVEDAAPLGVTLSRGTSDRGAAVEFAAFGVAPGSFLAPRAEEGRGLPREGDGIVISRALAEDEGVRVGDTVTVDRAGVTLPVRGITGRLSYGHVPAAYVPLRTWERIRFAVPGRTGAEAPHEYSAVALRTDDGKADVAAQDRASDTRTLALADTYAAAPGYTGERVTMTSIQVFLFLIAPLVVGAFFAVWTVQRAPELALLRALGASRARLLGQTLWQAAAVVVLGTLLGGLLALGLGAALGSAVPFSLPATTLLATLLAVAVVGLAGTALSLRRVTSPDPLTMLGAAR